MRVPRRHLEKCRVPALSQLASGRVVPKPTRSDELIAGLLAAPLLVEDLTCDDLRVLCEENDLTKGGNKGELLDRLGYTSALAASKAKHRSPPSGAAVPATKKQKKIVGALPPSHLPAHPPFPAALFAVVGKETRNLFELVKLIWAYVDAHGVPKRDGAVVCDAKLIAALNAPSFNFSTLPKLIGEALSGAAASAVDSAAAASKAATAFANAATTSSAISTAATTASTISTTTTSAAASSTTTAAAAFAEAFDMENIDAFQLTDSSAVKLTKKNLGDGSFGRVLKGTFQPHADGSVVEEVAVKELKSLDTFSNLLSAARRELKALAATHDVDGVAHLKCWFIRDETIFIVMPLFDGANLHTLLHSLDYQKRLLANDGQRMLRRFAWQIARALRCMHVRSGGALCHLDLKPANVVLTSREWSEASAVIVDFGSARILESTKSGTVSAQATPEYQSPESKFGEATSAADVWSFGVMLWEMFQSWPDQENKGRPHPQAITLAKFNAREPPNSLLVVNDARIRELVRRCWLAEAQRIKIDVCVTELERLGTATEAKENKIAALADFIRCRVDESNTIYHVGLKKRELRDWRRIDQVQTCARADIKQYLSEQQIDMLAEAIASNQFIHNCCFDDLKRFTGNDALGRQLDESMQYGIYLWRNRLTGQGYVGKIERATSTRRERDAEHLRGTSKFDVELRSNRANWQCVSVCATTPGDSAAITRLECLLILLLNTHLHRDGFNDELGGVWGATKRHL